MRDLEEFGMRLGQNSLGLLFLVYQQPSWLHFNV